MLRSLCDVLFTSEINADCYGFIGGFYLLSGLPMYLVMDVLAHIYSYLSFTSVLFSPPICESVYIYMLSDGTRKGQVAWG